MSHAKLWDILSAANCQGNLTVSCAKLGDTLSAILVCDNHYLGAAMLTLSLLSLRLKGHLGMRVSATPLTPKLMHCCVCQIQSHPDYTQLPVVFAAAANDSPP